MKGIIEGDLIIGVATHTGVNIPHTYIEFLRYDKDAKEVVDIRELSQPYTFYIDEKGIKHILQLNPNWQPLKCSWDDKLVNDNGSWRVKTETERLQEKKQEKQEELLSFEKQRVQKVCDEYGYNGLADVQLYTSQNDEEAKAILAWYSTYDDLIWSYIDNDLSAFTDIQELLAVDMKNIEQQIYQQSIQQSPLPQEA